jgi:hypothetical protein
MSQGMSSVAGTGSSAIETAFVQMYRQGFMQQFQQMTAKFAPYFQIVPQNSEYEYYDRIGIAEDMQEVSSRYHDNPVSEIPHDKRRIGLRDFEQGKYMEPKDLYRMASDPTNAYVTALKAAAHRKMDDIALERIFDIAYVGKKGEATVNFVPTSATGQIQVGEISKGHSRPITHTGTDPSVSIHRMVAGDYEGIDVPVDYDASGTPADSGITLEKLRAVRTTMERLEAIEQGEVLDCWITSDQADQLLSIDKVINADYAIRSALAEGRAATFMGYRFLRSERLKGSGTAADPRQCIVAKQSSMILAYSQQLTFDMWRDTSKRNIPYMYLFMGMDAVRMWGECTARVNCLDGLGNDS